jgi:hypothetical protein
MLAALNGGTIPDRGLYRVVETARNGKVVLGKGETVGLEVTPEVMGELAGIIEQAIDAGYTDLTAVDAAKIYQEREKERRAAYLKGVSPDDLTPEQHAKLREKRMETAKGLRTKKPASPAPVVERKRVHMHEVPSLKDFFDGKV